MIDRPDKGERAYNPAEKFGTPEGAPQTYLLEDGREVEEEEFLSVLMREAAENDVKRSPLRERDPNDVNNQNV